jgi:hypothetical protein
LGVVEVSEANGLFRRNRGCCDAPCAPAAPVEQKFEERKVKVYKPVMKEKEVEVLECKRVTKEEKYTYTVCVPVMKQEPRKVTYCEVVSKEVDATWTVMTPKLVDKKVTCTTYQCVRENVVEKVPVCRTVCTTYVDECGRCCVRRERVTTMEEVTRCVVKRIPIVEEKTIKVTICEPVVHKGKKTVCEVVRKEKDVMVNVCHIDRQERVGTRLVCHTVTEKVKRKVSYCEMVAEEVTVRVAICPPTTCCPTDCCQGRGHRGGLLRRGGDCCR